MKLTCPHCNIPLDLEALSEDDTQRQLFQMLGNLGIVAGHLIAYISLFRPAKQTMKWTQAYKRASEALIARDELGATDAMLAVALSETVNSVRNKWSQNGRVPLTGHNYLKKVLANTPNDTQVISAPQKTSKHGEARNALASLIRHD